jgi:formate dehydrogenase major subunit
LRPGQTSYWQNYDKFFVSFAKAMWGNAATKENDWAYDWLPKIDVVYDVLRAFELMHQGKMNGYFCQGFNPLMSFPNRRKLQTALEKLKFLVVMDPLATETSEFWQNYGEYNNVDPAKIQTEVFRLPTTVFAEENGSLINSGRWLQWHWKGAEPPAEAIPDIDIMARIYAKVRDLYRKDGGQLPDPVLNLSWNYEDPLAPQPEELARELNGKALVDVPDPRDATRVALRKGQQLSGFGELRNDGTTMSGCWLYTGSWTEAGNQMARRDNSDPGGLGLTPKWAWSWPANRRIMYNRASCDVNGKPFNPAKKQVWWDGERWTGYDVPDFVVTSKPEAGVGPFIMNPEGSARLFTRGLMRDGPFPEHYEPFEAPVPNALHPKVGPNPVARVFKGDMEVFGKPQDFPYVATTYRLTEHFHFWSKHVQINAVLQPQEFIEMGEELAKEKGIVTGDMVEVRSNRGRVKAVAVVTKRIKALTIDGKQVHTVGIPLHWGFTGAARKGFGCNQLTPYVGDANIETPEYKAFLVDVKKLGQATV